jgi:hypothetical protein
MKTFVNISGGGFALRRRLDTGSRSNRGHPTIDDNWLPHGGQRSIYKVCFSTTAMSFVRNSQGRNLLGPGRRVTSYVACPAACGISIGEDREARPSPGGPDHQQSARIHSRSPSPVRLKTESLS